MRKSSITICDNISFLPGTEEPLSSNVYRIQGEKRTWFFDVGMGCDPFGFVEETEGEKGIVISHFHQDHMGNLQRFIEEDNESACLGKNHLYVGKNTFRYCKAGSIVENGEIAMEDGVFIRLFPLPSSHAKGSIAMAVDETYLFVGDGLGPMQKNGELLYNKQLLLELIRLLKKQQAPYIVTGHGIEPILATEKAVHHLETILSRAQKEQAFIPVTHYGI